MKYSQFVAVNLLKIKLCGNEHPSDTPPSVEALRQRADGRQVLAEYEDTLSYHKIIFYSIIQVQRSI